MRVTKEHSKGKLGGFPLEVVRKMCERQMEQGNKFDPVVFQRHITANHREGGFYWPETPEGEDFWRQVIVFHEFKLFFEKYPKNEYQKRMTTTEKLYDKAMRNAISIIYSECDLSEEGLDRFYKHEDYSSHPEGFTPIEMYDYWDHIDLVEEIENLASVFYNQYRDILHIAKHGIVELAMDDELDDDLNQLDIHRAFEVGAS